MHVIERIVREAFKGLIESTVVPNAAQSFGPSLGRARRSVFV